MAIKTGDQVKFFYAGQTSALPAQKEENTIYFNAEGQQILVGNQVVASVTGNADLSGYVTKDNATVKSSLGFAPPNASSDKGHNSIQWEDDGFHLYAFDEENDNSTQAVLDGVADPTSNYQAANKKYVDEAIAAIPGVAWTVG